MTAWLLTWLWQGTALAAGVAVALACAPRVNAATRHLIWWGSLAALACLGWASSPFRGLTPVPVRGSDPIYVPSAPDTLITIVIGIWAAIALVSVLRLLPGLRGVHALRDRCEPFPTSVESRLPLWLDARARGRRALLMICDAAPGATVLGFERPCIAIPSSLVAGLTIDELDQVILHEHAHVQRRDDWSRLAQTLLFTVLWVHPAALFVSRALSREREMACDEWVVARTGQPKAYARCLARAAELRLQMRGGPALMPALVGGRHELGRRVDRLLAMPATPGRTISPGAVAVAACAMMLVSVQLHSVRFAEIAEIVLPHVSAPMRAAYKSTATVRLSAAARPMQASFGETRRSLGEGGKADPTYNAPNGAADAPDAPLAPLAPSLSARTFPGAYSAPGSSTFAPAAHIASADKPNAPNHWVEIASTAKKTSLGIAGVFTRAGASLARSF